jgi:hypothetical protein
MQEGIRIQGAREHNLRGVDVDLPRDRLVVCGRRLSKSSLALGTSLGKVEAAFPRAGAALIRGPPRRRSASRPAHHRQLEQSRRGPDANELVSGCLGCATGSPPLGAGRDRTLRDLRASPPVSDRGRSRARSRPARHTPHRGGTRAPRRRGRRHPAGDRAAGIRAYAGTASRSGSTRTPSAAWAISTSSRRSDHKPGRKASRIEERSPPHSPQKGRAGRRRR